MSDSSTVSHHVDFLRKRASSLAKAQSWTEEKKPYQSIKPSLAASKKDLRDAYRILSEATRREQEISSAAEWLIDNFYIIQEQLVQVENDFPKEYQQSIPRLIEGNHKGLPRVYELALNLILYKDYVVEIDSLTNFVQSYQEQEVLKLGEIWAIPITKANAKGSRIITQIGRSKLSLPSKKRVRYSFYYSICSSFSSIYFEFKVRNTRSCNLFLPHSYKKQ